MRTLCFLWKKKLQGVNPSKWRLRIEDAAGECDQWMHLKWAEFHPPADQRNMEMETAGQEDLSAHEYLQ
ncbi:MAG: hypothetical protein VW643_06905 [Opitutales bacterium]